MLPDTNPGGYHTHFWMEHTCGSGVGNKGLLSGSGGPVHGEGWRVGAHKTFPGSQWVWYRGEEAYWGPPNFLGAKKE